MRVRRPPMRQRPVRIDQIIPSIVERDAVSHHTLEAQKVPPLDGLRLGDLLPATWGPDCTDGSISSRISRKTSPERQWVCYQASIGSPAADVFASHPGLKLLDYHNIGPAKLVERWLPHLGEEVRLGRTQLRARAVGGARCADSEFNRLELEEAGYRKSAVAPLMLDRTNLSCLPDLRPSTALPAARAGGGHDWLFVGQMLPHKAHEDVIKALVCSSDDVRSQGPVPSRREGRAVRPTRMPSTLCRRPRSDRVVKFAGSVAPGAPAYYTERGRVRVLLGS